MACAARGRFCNSAAGLFYSAAVNRKVVQKAHDREIGFLLTVRKVMEKWFRKRMIKKLFFNSAQENGKVVQKADVREIFLLTVRHLIQ